MADIKNFGIKGIASDVQMGKSGGRLKYDSANSRFDLTASDGTTLENLRVGSVTAGSWTADAIATQYGGLGGDFSSDTGVITFTDGVATAGAIDLGNTSFVSGIVGVANGGTGASTASGARTNLGLGTIATQDSDSISITGGSLDGVTIGGTTAGAGSFTTLSATGGISGDLTGDVTGNLTGNVTGDVTGDVTGTVSDISNHDTDALSEGSSNLYFTDARARGAISVTDAGGDGSLSYNSTTGVLTYTGPSAAEVRAHFSGGTGISITNGEVKLDDTAVTAGAYGSTTAIPVLTIDQQGRVTAASTATIATSFDIAGDSGTDTVAGGETLTFSGTANQIVSTVSDNEVTFALASDLSVNNLSVTGTLSSDDITASQVTVSGDAVVTGNLTVQGTQTIVNTETVSVADAIIRVNSDGTAAPAGFEANLNGTIESLLYDPTASVSPDSNDPGAWVFSDDVIASETLKANTVQVTSKVVGNLEGDVTGDVTGNLTGNVTGNVTGDLTGDVTGNVTGNVTGDLTGDVTGNLTGNVTGNVTGNLTGDVTGDVTGNLTGNVTGDVTGNLTGDVTGQVSDISNHDTDDLAEGAINQYWTEARGEAMVDAYVTGGTGITVSSGTVDLDDTAVTAGSYGSSTEIPTFTVDAQGRLTAAGTASISTNIGLAGDTGTDNVAGGETITFTGGDNVTSAVANNSVTFSLDSDISLTSVTATGAVEGGSLTDGTATLASGSLTGGVNGTFSGTVTGGTLTDGTASLSGGALTGMDSISASGSIQGGSLTDGTATLSSGSLSGAVDVSASGNVTFGGLSDGSILITGFADEDNMASDSASLIPTQQSVKAYVDSKVTAQDLDFGGDTGTGAVDLDSQSLTISGGNNITTTASGQGLTVALDSSLTGLTSVTATSFTGDLTGDVTGDVTGNVTGNLTGDVTGDVTGNLTGNVTGNVTGNLTGDVTGDVTGTVSSIANHSTTDLAEGTNLYFTTTRARNSISVTDAGGDGSLAYNASTGVITYTGPSAAETRAHFSAGTGLEVAAGEFAISDTGVTAAQYGSTTAIPVLTINAQGQVTAAETATIATSFDIAGDTGTDTVAGGETLTFSGTANQIVSTVTDNEVTFALANDLSVANVTVTGTLNSDDITATQVSVAGDAVITGNLTVQGTQTIVESTTVSTNDAIFRVNSNGTTGTDVGFEANVGGSIKSIVYDGATSKWTVGAETFVAQTFEGDLTGDVTGTVSDISNHDTDSLAEGASNLYFTNARARGAISVTDNGGDGSLSYDSATGVISYTGPSAAEVRAHFSAGTGVTLAAGQISIGQDVSTTSNVTFNQVTADVVGDVTGQVSDISNHDTDSLAEGSSNLYWTTARGEAMVDGYVTGGTGVDVSSGVVSIGQDVGTTADVTFNSVTGDLTGDVTGNLTGNVTGNVTGDVTGDLTGNVTFGSLSDGSVSVTDIQTTLTDVDTAVPTSGAVVDYVTNNAGDGLIVRSAISADSTNASFSIGDVPNVTGRTYYAAKIVVKVSTAFSGGSINHILIKDNAGAGSVLVEADDADATTVGTYIVELDGTDALVKGQSIDLLLKQSDGITDAVATAGAMTVTVHYNWV